MRRTNSRTEWHSVRLERPRRRTERHSVLRFLGTLLFVACCSVSTAAELVRAELGKETAWTGEPVPLFITLYSPGPFSGTASFELPELPKSVFVRTANPLVGSEPIGGESYFTQRHEFAIYTQRAGTVVIPAFLVRVSGKKSFTSAAEPVEEYTPELTIQSTRPPGTEQLGVVVAARNMEVSQTWQPDARGGVQAGDVIARTVSRRANGTTAMLLPSIEIETPAGVRCYATDPIVLDNTERGASLAVRSDTIKYQFERAGTFQLPDVSVVWWDPEANVLKRESLPGKIVDVLQWERAVKLEDTHLSGRLPPDAAAQWANEWNVLSRHVFGVGPSSSPWRGRRVARLFSLVRHTRSHASRKRCMDVALPALNPTGPRNNSG